MIKKLKEFLKKYNLNPVKNRKRVGVILVVVAIGIFLIFTIRLVYIVGVGKIGNTSLDAKIENLYQGKSIVRAKRGTIFDREGNPIAEDATSYSLYAILDENYLGINKEILYVKSGDHEKIATILNQYAGVDKQVVLEQLTPKKNNEGKPITTVEFGAKGKNITLETKNKIEDALKKEKISGIYFNEHPARMYPNGVFASHLIGFSQLADAADETKGLTGTLGIEEAYNDVLGGKDGEISYQKDNQGRRLPGTTTVLKKAEDGKDIYTTLDANLQIYLEELMSKAVEEYKPEEITAILMEAKTGNILAASQRPTFNPETKEGLEDSWRNVLVEDPFEPGSTMKVFTVASAIEAGVFNPNATFQSGSINVDGTTINDWLIGGRGLLTYRQALAWSSNVGMVHLEQMMGDKWQNSLLNFGFTKSTNSGLNNEETGSLQNSTTVDRAMSAYGQAIAVTNFQMMQGFTAIANQGKMLKPQFIQKVVDEDGHTTLMKPDVVGTPITATTASQVLDYMRDVVDDRDFGTGFGYYNIEGYDVSAKTGTAQIYDTENGGYLKDQYTSSVVQIAPTEDPEYIMYVTVKKLPAGTGVKDSKVISEISNPVLKRALDLDVANSQTTTK